MARVFDVRPDERRATVFAFFALLGITAAHTLVETSRDALFLAKVPVERLPLLYLAIAGAGLATTRVGAWLEARRARSPKRGGIDPVVASIFGAAAITVGFWAGAASPGRGVLYALYIYSGMFASWVAGRLWIRLGEVFTVAQAKRLYGFIGTGGVLGAVFGAALARASLVAVEVRHLLLVGAGLLVVTAIGPAALLPRPPAAPPKAHRDDDDHEAADDDGLGARIREVVRHPYLVRLLGLAVLAAVAGTTIDFLFKREVAAAVPKADLASFLATVSLATNLASLVAQAVGVTLAMRVLGVHRALYVMPLLLAVGAASALAGLGLIAALALRGIDGTLRHSLHKTSSELLFVPLGDRERARAKPIIDLLGQRGGQAFASVALLVLAAVFGTRLGVVTGGIVAAIAFVWLVLARDLRPRYLDVFRRTLRRGRAELSSDMPVLDVDALGALIAALSSRKDAEVLGALDILAAQERGRLIPSLILFHPSKPIVLRALDLLVREGRTDFVAAADRLLSHADGEVRTAALRARTAVEPDPELLRSLLDGDATPDDLRATALVALVAGTALSGEEADRALAKLEATPDVRRVLARALGEVHRTPEGAARALLEKTARMLAHDDDVETRALAATAMGRLGSSELVEDLVALLGDRRAGVAAVDALAAMGETARPKLEQLLASDDTVAEVKWRAVRALAASGTSTATLALGRHLLATKDTAVRTRVLLALRGLVAAGHALPVTATELTELAEQTIAQLGRTLALRLALAELSPPGANERPGATLLTQLLRDKELEARDRLFVVLGLLYPRERFARIHRGLDDANPKTRASSRELLENVVGAPLREKVLAVTDEIGDAERLARIGARRTEETYDELVTAMMDQGGELGAIAAYHAKEIGLRHSTREPLPLFEAGA